MQRSVFDYEVIVILSHNSHQGIKDDWDVHRNCRVNNNPKICCKFYCTYYLNYNVLSSEILLNIILYNYVYVA